MSDYDRRMQEMRGEGEEPDAEMIEIEEERKEAKLAALKKGRQVGRQIGKLVDAIVYAIALLHTICMLRIVCYGSYYVVLAPKYFSYVNKAHLLCALTILLYIAHFG